MYKVEINKLLIMSAIKTHKLSQYLAEIERLQKGETKKEPEKETYLDLFATKNLKLKERVLIPIKQYPRVSSSCQALTFYGFFPPQYANEYLIYYVQ